MIDRSRHFKLELSHQIAIRVRCRGTLLHLITPSSTNLNGANQVSHASTWEREGKWNRIKISALQLFSPKKDVDLLEIDISTVGFESKSKNQIGVTVSIEF